MSSSQGVVLARPVATLVETAAIDKSEGVTAWFRPESQQDVDDSSKVIRLAYEKAMLFHQEQSKSRRKAHLTSFFESTSIDDVLSHVRQVEQHHVTAKEGKNRVSKSISSGWTTTVSRINAFSSAIDVLVSSHPEYAAPVWGTIKFFFTATLNHQELASKVTESFAAISNALPELDFLANQLYPVPNIQQTLASIYTHVVDFCIRALKWYHKAGSSFFRKAVAAIKDPWALEFEDVVRQIQNTTARIRQQATVAHQAETRYISSMVADVRLEVLNLRNENMAQNFLKVTEPAGPILSIDVPPNPPKQPLTLPSIPFIPAEMSKYLQSIPFDSEKDLSRGIALRNRRRVRSNAGWDDIWASTKLRDWISQPGSALVELQGSLITTDASRDFAFDMIDLVKSTKLPLACTEEDWLQLLVAVLDEFSRIVLILDSHGEGSQAIDAVDKFWALVDERKITTAIKMLLLTYPAPGVHLPAILPRDGIASFTVTLGQDRRPGSARASMHGNARGQRRAGPRSAGGPSLLKPFVLQLTEVKRDSEHGL
ncbi:hypothetical protein AK830_g11550 [Neonectria ditissima]|uniref:DUF7708 domain-containing protein n=1 Tax=Neonectria ditissima TaxID=78410 RepID=A0A0P7B142_9HYPO|nr:hypothetical protein AK830_g11550 [Neonectria ditissima]